jgi:hypothetical protein
MTVNWTLFRCLWRLRRFHNYENITRCSLDWSVFVTPVNNIKEVVSLRLIYIMLIFLARHIHMDKNGCTYLLKGLRFWLSDYLSIYRYGFTINQSDAFNLPNEPIPECAKHHGSLVTQQNFSTWRLYFSNEGRC